MSLIFQNQTKTLGLTIMPRLYRRLAALAVMSRPLETCGVILGKLSEDRAMATVTEIIEACKKHEPRHSCIDVDKGMAAIDKAWGESNGKVHYLGDWHSHPNNPPTPSPEDVQNAMNHLEQDPDQGEIISIIIGNKFTERDLWVRIYFRDSFQDLERIT